jgi:hypothetical protein
MNRSYINDVKFNHEDIKLRRPKKERPQRVSKGMEGLHKNLLKVLFTLFIIVTTLFVINFTIITTLHSFFPDSGDYTNVIQLWNDAHEYAKHH